MNEQVRKKIYGRQFSAVVYGTAHGELILKALDQARGFFGPEARLEAGESDYRISPSVSRPGQYIGHITVREVLRDE